MARRDDGIPHLFPRIRRKCSTVSVVTGDRLIERSSSSVVPAALGNRAGPLGRSSSATRHFGRRRLTVFTAP